MDTGAEKISDMEAEVMKVLWQKNRPMTYAEIRTSINQTYDLKTQVINTMIKRLVQKGILSEEKRDVYYYQPLVSEDAYVKSKTMTLVHKIFGGDVKNLLSALVHYDQVTPDDLEQLRSFWQKGRESDE